MSEHDHTGPDSACPACKPLADVLRQRMTWPSMHWDDTCVCTHSRSAHIYESGACRPGYRCDSECGEFRAADRVGHDDEGDGECAHHAYGVCDCTNVCAADERPPAPEDDR